MFGILGDQGGIVLFAYIYIRGQRKVTTNAWPLLRYVQIHGGPTPTGRLPPPPCLIPPGEVTWCIMVGQWLGTCLRTHPDQRFIVDGIRSGFRVCFRYNHLTPSTPSNMLSAREHLAVIRGYLVKECSSEGRVLNPSFPVPVHTSCFRVIPKGSSGK